MRILGIDPGPVTCGVCYLDGGVPIDHSKDASIFDAVESAAALSRFHEGLVAIEIPQPRGIPMPMSAIWTAMNAGRIAQMADKVRFYFPPSIRAHHCGRGGAKDPMVKQAIIDRFGGKAKAVGLKKTPGPLYGIKGHAWSALAVALMCADELEKGIDTSAKPE